MSKIDNEWINNFNDVNSFLESVDNIKISTEYYFKISEIIYTKLKKLFPDAVVINETDGEYTSFDDLIDLYIFLLRSNKNYPYFYHFHIYSIKSTMEIMNKILIRVGFKNYQFIFKPRRFYRFHEYFIIKNKKGK